MKPAEDMLSTLRSGAQPSQAHIQEFIDSDLGYMWPYACFSEGVDARLGEYGYVDRSCREERFVRLGHIDDLHMKDQSTAAEVRYRHRMRGSATPWVELPHWPDHVIR